MDNFYAVMNRAVIGGAPTLLGAIIAQEREYGRIVLPGEADWFAKADWHDDSLCSTDGKRVRIVLLRARKPGEGAFKRLIDAIHDEGMQPVVVEPLGFLKDKLQAWGWRHRRVYKANDAHDIWYPR